MDYLYVFLIGGAFCVIAQLLIDKTKLSPANILVIYVCAGVVLGAVGLYKPLIDFASSGASVPLTGFGYVLANGVREAVDQYGLVGCLMGGLTASATGVTAAMVFGVIWALIFKSKEK